MLHLRVACDDAMPRSPRVCEVKLGVSVTVQLQLPAQCGLTAAQQLLKDRRRDAVGRLQVVTHQRIWTLPLAVSVPTFDVLPEALRRQVIESLDFRSWQPLSMLHLKV